MQTTVNTSNALYNGNISQMINAVAEGANSSKYVYIRDANGTTMGVAQNDQITEIPIYGSKRLGQFEPRETHVSSTIGVHHRRYEFSNHLGNVLVTLNDLGNVLSYSDYFPFGLSVNDRSWSEGGYRYGFNGKENDTDLSSSQLIQDYGFRVYYLVIGKFLSVDPLTKSYPWYTPYQFAGNIPIAFVDIDSLEPGKNSPHYGKNIILGSKSTHYNLNNSKEGNDFWIPFHYQSYNTIEHVVKLLNEIYKNNKNLKKFIDDQKVNKFSNLKFYEDQEIPILSNFSYHIKNDGGCLKAKNVFYITDSSNLTEDKILEFILNNGKKRHLSESPIRALIVLAFSDDYQVENISKVLEKIINVYKKTWKLYSKKS